MKTYIIYLAAGNSRRFKEDKLHALFKGKELYLYGIDTLKQLLKYHNGTRQKLENIRSF